MRIGSVRRARPSRTIGTASVLLLAMAFAGAAAATTYTVGAGAGCTHGSFLLALNAATTDASPGPHRIRIALPSITLADSAYAISNPLQDIHITGGFTSCAATSPIGQTVLNRVDPNLPVLEIANSVSNPRRLVVLERLTLQGANVPSGVGGGLRVTNKVTVVVDDASNIQNNVASSGGGVALLTLSTDPAIGPRVILSRGSRICNNTANGPGGDGNGGGVFLLGASELELWDGLICGNQARRHGGGVYMAGIANRLSIDPRRGERVSIDTNRSGTAGFAAGTGFGGGVYAGPGSTIHYPTDLTPATEVSLNISSNEANFGGGLFAEGGDAAGDPFTVLELRNALLGSNVARGTGGALELRNAVDLRLVKFGTGRCVALGVPVPCVLGIGNRARNNGGDPTFGAGGFARLSHGSDAQRPALRVAGALFMSNEDENGTAAVIDARGGSAVRILRSVFANNIAAGTDGFRAMVESRSEVLFAFNTVLSNSVNHLLWVGASGTVNATGSILYSPGVTPYAGPFAALVHSGCLLSHTASGLPPGVTVLAPQLGPGYEPEGTSPAVDRCANGVGDVFWPATRDAYGVTAPIDIPGVANIGGPWDLGAVERRETLFADGFE